MDKRPKATTGGLGMHGEVPVEGKPVKPLE
jgi:hypothetical protein